MSAVRLYLAAVAFIVGGVVVHAVGTGRAEDARTACSIETTRAEDRAQVSRFLSGYVPPAVDPASCHYNAAPFEVVALVLCSIGAVLAVLALCLNSPLEAR